MASTTTSNLTSSSAATTGAASKPSNPPQPHHNLTKKQTSRPPQTHHNLPKKQTSRPPQTQHNLAKKDYRKLKEIFQCHIESFDYMVEKGLEKMFESLEPISIFDPFSKTNLRIWFSKPEIYPPQKERSSRGQMDTLYPFECRQAKISYTGKFTAEVCYQYDDRAVLRDRNYNFGQLPIMLKSKKCILRGDSEEKIVAHKEEPSEMGGYFILNGLERVIRLLILPKRNYPQSTIRSSFTARQEGYSDKAVIIRCVRQDQSAVSVKLYYLNNGSARLGFWIQGREYMLPVGVLLKALTDTTDHEIYASLTSYYDSKFDRAKGCVGTQLIGERAKIILDEVRTLSLYTRSQCLKHIGEYFRPVMIGHENDTSSAVAAAVLRNFIFVHLDYNQDKFNLLIFMLQKLFSLVDGTSMPDNPDALQNQEVLLPGHLLTIYLKEKLQELLLRIKRNIMEDLANPDKKFDLGNWESVKKIIERNSPRSIGSSIENMLKTGTLATQSGLDLQQRAGMTVMAERLNFLRFISHFRAVHRGSSFAGLRTTSVRKLLPESWGFMCPVHTPDGAPCGLLNHMTAACRITSFYDSAGKIRDFFEIKKSILSILVGVGMTPSLPKNLPGGPPEVLSVLLDGCVVGSMPSAWVEKAIMYLRKLKLSAKSPVPHDLEVGYIPPGMCGAFPGLYLSTTPARFLRPVKNISVPPQDDNDIEYIGPLEQVYMEISCPDGLDGGRRNQFPATHEEIHPTGILSVVANLTPWSDHNQSPRNMYQCQMGKQTMGFSSQAINCRADQKLYHLQTPQTPIVRTKTYDNYCIDDNPLGTNAIVAVLTYSGYDMEDAMILNKSSVERGMCHGHIYQTETIDLTEQSRNSTRARRIFQRSNQNKQAHDFVDTDGLPYVGKRIYPDEPYCSIYNAIEGTTKLTTLKGTAEPVTVDYVAVDMKTRKKANIRFRRSRNPIIGDKFSSRHGQKGVCSQLWADIDMPFSAVTGMRPDLIINPHAFPSRMTIGMLLESMAAKGGSIRGEFVDATPFPDAVKKNDEDEDRGASSLVDEFGAKLAAAGFNYHGVEVLYSGFSGTELNCEIFIGPVYYQRLRHMVSDKYQVRSTGVVDQLTRQPIKGRKRGGGIRFGEMERDSLIAHGAAYLLHDRLHTSSDHHIADVCSGCGSVLTTSLIQPPKRAVREMSGLPPPKVPKKVTCVSCKSSKGMETVAMPYVFKYLAAELASMNIKMTLQLSKGAGA